MSVLRRWFQSGSQQTMRVQGRLLHCSRYRIPGDSITSPAVDEGQHNEKDEKSAGDPSGHPSDSSSTESSSWSNPMLLRLFSCGSAGFRDDSDVVRAFWVES